MTRLAGESAWNVLPALMFFLTIYSIYHLVKDGKRKDKEKKLNLICTPFIYKAKVYERFLDHLRLRNILDGDWLYRRRKND